MSTAEDSPRPDSAKKLPVHVGIIMDGNGRWAKQRKLKRTRGHTEGIEAAKRVVSAAQELGIQYLSLYSFSTENWRRAEEEVSFIMALVARNLRGHYDFYRENQIRLYHSGNIAGLPPEVRSEIATVTADTKDYTGIRVNLAVNYGGRDEIVRAVNRWIEAHGHAPDHELTIDELRPYLDLPEFPDPDLIIRSGGHLRLSNFLLWESAYSELYFSDRLWPDWTGDDLVEAIRDYQRRQRNYGGVK